MECSSKYNGGTPSHLLLIAVKCMRTCGMYIMPWWNYWGQIGPQFYQIIPKWFYFLHILSLRVSKARMASTSSEDRSSDLWTLIWQKVRRFLQLNARDSGARLTHRSLIFQVSILFCQRWNSAKWDWGSSLAQVEAYRTVCSLFNQVTWKISQRVIPKAHAKPTESKF